MHDSLSFSSSLLLSSGLLSRNVEVIVVRPHSCPTRTSVRSGLSFSIPNHYVFAFHIKFPLLLCLFYPLVTWIFCTTATPTLWVVAAHSRFYAVASLDVCPVSQCSGSVCVFSVFILVFLPFWLCLRAAITLFWLRVEVFLLHPALIVAFVHQASKI